MTMNFEEALGQLNQVIVRIHENRQEHVDLMDERWRLSSSLRDLSPIKVGDKVRYCIEPRQDRLWSMLDMLEGTAYVVEVDIIEGYIGEGNTIVGPDPSSHLACELCYRLGQPVLTSKGKQVIRKGQPQFDELYLGRVFLRHLTKVDP